MRRLTNLAAASEAECLQKIWAAARRGEFRGREVLEGDEIAECERQARE